MYHENCSLWALKTFGQFSYEYSWDTQTSPFSRLVPLWIFKWKEVIITPNKRPPGMNMHERKGLLCASMEIQHLSSGSSRNHLEPLVAQYRIRPLIKQKASHRSFLSTTALSMTSCSYEEKHESIVDILLISLYIVLNWMNLFIGCKEMVQNTTPPQINFFYYTVDQVKIL